MLTAIAIGFVLGASAYVLFRYFALQATCTCGHSSTAHEHYRPGSDCALCPCTEMRNR